MAALLAAAQRTCLGNESHINSDCLPHPLLMASRGRVPHSVGLQQYHSQFPGDLRELLRVAVVVHGVTLRRPARSADTRRGRGGKFPKRVAISPGRVGWRESQLTDWMDALSTPGMSR